METQSNEITEVLKAKSEAENNFAKLKKSGNNPHFKSKYATLGDIYDACRDALKAEGLMTYHQTFESDQGVGIACTLFHAESGQFIRTFLPLKTGTAQQTGSEITYMRRYTIQCVLSLEGEFDDDGNEAQQIREKKTSDPDWVGPLAKIKLLEAGRAIRRDIYDCEDLDSLVALQNSKETIKVTKQLKVDTPHHWDHEPDPTDDKKNYLGLSQHFKKRAEELENGIRT